MIVENQFLVSNHNHLGQLLAYAAGTEADVVVWIAESFTDEHLAALEWMNAAMSEGAGFFAITLKAVKIGSSNHASANAAQRDFQEWDWEKYSTILGVASEKLTTAKRIVVEIDQRLQNRGRPMRLQFRKGYVAFQRGGGYNVFLVDVFWNRAPRLAAKIPTSPEELGLVSPYPDLSESFDSGQKEWGFGPISGDALPDLEKLLDLVLPFHPEQGPMVIPPPPA